MGEIVSRSAPLRALDHLEEWLVALLMGAATVVIFIAVVHRYASGMPIPYLQDWLLERNLGWAQETCIYMFVWMAKFGAAYGVRTGIHVGVDVLINALSDRTRFKFIVFGLLSGAVFTAIIGSLGTHFVWSLAGTDQVSPDLEMPMWIIYLAIPLGTFLMCFRFLQVLVYFWQTGELPRHDHGKVAGLDEVVADAGLTPANNALHPADLHQKHTDSKERP